MKKMLGLLCAFALLASQAEARVSRATPQVKGGSEVTAFVTASLATNAIDTLVVGPINPAYGQVALVAADSTAATAGRWIFHYTIQFEGLASSSGGAATTDSLDVATDFSYDGQNFIQKVAIGTVDATNASTTYDGFFLYYGGSSTPPPYLRFRLQNDGAGTGKLGVTISWRRQQ